MVRLGSALALALTIAFGGAVISGSMSEAAAKGKAGVCKQTTLAGKVKKWSCKTDQVCCALPILGFYGCGSKTFGCLDAK